MHLADLNRTEELKREQVSKIPLVLIVGPTAVGKTEIAVQTAERLDAEIICADSRTLYTGMDIGTAKPTLSQRKKITHHMVDVARPDQTWSLAKFQREVEIRIREINRRGVLPIMVGGTGQYIRAVIEGWEVPPVTGQEKMRSALENWALDIGSEGLHQRLAVIDKDAADRIESNNLRRTIRALEVIFNTGKRFSLQYKRREPVYRLLILGLDMPRPELYDRVDKRIEAMFEAGLVDEVSALLSAGYSPDLPSMSAIGYKQVIQYLQGKISIEEAKMEMRRSTRVFVRRQANWFRHDDPRIRWYPVGEETAAKLVKDIRTWLNAMPE
jgi:tRNA dimethylallyltransferase